MRSEPQRLSSIGDRPAAHSVLVVFFFSVFYSAIFLPALLSGHPLASHETFLQFWPAFFAKRTAWTTLLFSGFPLMGDPQTMMWYPVSLLFSWLGGLWNGFVLSAYTLASSFMYGYVYTLTRSKFAAVMGAVAYGMNGFLMIRLVHTNIIHTAVWLPLLIWSLEIQRRRQSRNWMAVTSIAIACGALAGHPQIWLYSLGVAALYVLAMASTSPVGRLRFIKSSLAGVLLGVGLAGILLVPMIELARNSVRSSITAEYAATYSLGFAQLPLILFPFLSTDLSLAQGFPWFELTGYIGFVPLVFACIALCGKWKDRSTVCWFTVAVAALVLALGPSTPIGRLFLFIPVYNMFRAPGRHLFEFAFAISVLCGQGVWALQELPLERRATLLHRTLAGVAIVTVGGGLLLIRTENRVVIIVPFVVLALCALACRAWAKNPSPARSCWLVMVLVLDLGHLSYLAVQREIISTAWNTKKPEYIDTFESTLRISQQRMSPLRAADQPFEAAPANLSRFWGLSSIGGYNPLVLRKFAELTGVFPNGQFPYRNLDSQDRSLDVLALRYLLVPNSLVSGAWQTERFGMGWRYDDLQTDLGSGCGRAKPQSLSFKVPGVTATRIGVVSSLSCSVPILDQTPVMKITAVGSDGSMSIVFLKAGTDTSEWAWDRSDVRPAIRHSRATVFDSFASVDDTGAAFQGHHFVGILHMPAMRVGELRLEWQGNAGMISLQKLSLSDDSGKQSYAITREADYLVDNDRWRKKGTSGETTVYENTRAMPRAWVVPKAMNLSAAATLDSIRTSRLPDGTIFDPAKIALTEVPITLDPSTDFSGTADVSLVSEDQIRVLTRSNEAGFLVLSDINYPGWRASIDGNAATLYRADYLLQGVVLPPGEHVVEFRFRSLSWAAGMALSAACVLALSILVGKRQRQ